MRQAAQRRGQETALSEGVKCRQQVGHMGLGAGEAKLPSPAQCLSSDRSSVCCSHPGPAAGGWNQPLAWALRRREVWPLNEGELCSQLSTAGEQARARRNPPVNPHPHPPRAHLHWQSGKGSGFGRQLKGYNLGSFL